MSSMIHCDAISPYTGLVRDDWEALADRLLDAVQPYATSSFARV